MSNTKFLRKKLRRSALFVSAAAIVFPLLASYESANTPMKVAPVNRSVVTLPAPPNF